MTASNTRPGPRPLGYTNLKTSVRILGDDQVDEFRALCVLLGRRPHQLAADMVLTEIRRYRTEPVTASAVGALVESARSYRTRHGLDNPEPRRHRSGLYVVDGYQP